MRQVQATDAEHRYPFRSYLTTRILTSCTALVLIFLVAWLGYSTSSATVICVVGLAKAVESISDLIFGALQQHERMELVSISMLIKGPLSLVGLGLGVYLFNNVLWGVIGMLLAWMTTPILLDLPNVLRVTHRWDESHPQGAKSRFAFAKGWRFPRLQWDLQVMKKLVWLGLPLGFTMFLLTVNSNIPKYIIDAQLGPDVLGTYGVMAYFILAGQMVVTALGQSATPRLSRYWAGGNRHAYNRLLIKLVGLGGLFGVIAVVCALTIGQMVLSLLFGVEYAERMDVFAWLMVAAGLSYMGSFLGFSVTATRAFHRFTIPYLILTLVTLSVAIPLISNFGLLGAAWTMCVYGVGTCVTPLAILTSLKTQQR
jgi:O-antigen/teichoic acid export membrane protein